MKDWKAQQEETLSKGVLGRPADCIEVITWTYFADRPALLYDRHEAYRITSMSIQAMTPLLAETGFVSDQNPPACAHTT